MERNLTYRLTAEIKRPSRFLVLARATTQTIYRFLRILRSELWRIPDYHDEAARRAEALRKLYCGQPDPDAPRFGETVQDSSREPRGR